MKIGRNDICICGSEKKYKRCCLLKVEIFSFKVTYYRDQAYRCSIRLSGENDLFDLHHKIQAAYHWDNDHMFSFFMDNKLWNKKSEYSGSPFGEGSGAERLLKNLSLAVGQKFLYVFDYGDEHCFEIEVLSIDREIPPLTSLGIIETKGTPPKQYFIDG